MRVDGERLHLVASPEVTDDVLSLWEQATGKIVPALSRKAPRYGRRRLRPAPEGQLTIDDMLATA